MEAAYTADLPISNVVLHGDTVAYLTGPVNYADPDALCVLEIKRGGQPVRSIPLGPSERSRAPHIGPMALLPDNRLLYADSLGSLNVRGIDGSEPGKTADVTVGNFVYHDRTVYFENMEQLDAFGDVYCREQLAFDDTLTFSSLCRAGLEDGGAGKRLFAAVQGLTSWGDKIVFQDMYDHFVLPYGELPEDWLKGMLYVYDAEESQGAAAGRRVTAVPGDALRRRRVVQPGGGRGRA